LSSNYSEKKNQSKKAFTLLFIILTSTLFGSINIMVVNAFSITTETLPAATLGQYYTQILDTDVAAEQEVLVSWTVYSGALPRGLEIVRDSQGFSYIQGYPSNIGTTFTLKASYFVGITRAPIEATRQFTIVVNQVTEHDFTYSISSKYLTIDTTNLYYGLTQSASASFDVTITRTQGNPNEIIVEYFWESTPYGVTITPDQGYIGYDSSPFVATFTFTVGSQWSNLVGRWFNLFITFKSGTKQYQDIVTLEFPNPQTEFSVYPDSLPDAKTGMGYKVELFSTLSSEANKKLTWITYAGVPPDGLQLVKESDGLAYVKGTPTKAGDWTFTVGAYYLELGPIIYRQYKMSVIARAGIEFVISKSPVVLNITETQAVVQWETTEEGNSRVIYGSIAGYYTYEKLNDYFSIKHSITLAGLEPLRTYHLLATSEDRDGNIVKSRELSFETSPNYDNLSPHLVVFDPGLCQAITTIKAEASDNIGIECVEFYLDGKPIFIDYSEPFQLSLNTTNYGNGSHNLRVKALDRYGLTTVTDHTIQVLNIQDEAAPTVTITSPKQYDKVTGKTEIKVSLIDDVGLAQIFFKVDGISEGFEGSPGNPKSKTTTFDWDTKYVPNGVHRLTVEAWDKDLHHGVATCDVIVDHPPAKLPPKLMIVSHTTRRIANYFITSITVENIGETEAREVTIADFLTAFQPISGSDKYADYQTGFIYFSNKSECLITCRVPIPPKQSLVFSFESVPLMLPTSTLPGIAPMPSIGDPVEVYYKDSEGVEYNDEYNVPVFYTVDGEYILTAYWNSLKSSDYLIITDPKRLVWYNNVDETNKLLSVSAQLAKLKQGALGYALYPLKSYDIRNLIKFGGPWSNVLKNGWLSNGYLLIVGETEIIPNWYKVAGTLETDHGDYTFKGFTDYPYASTFGEETKPELSVARVLGNNAAELRKVIQNSINTYLGIPGFKFDRSQALLASGYPATIGGWPGSGMDFMGEVNSASMAIFSKNPISVNMNLNTPDFNRYVQPGVNAQLDYQKTHDAIRDDFFSVTPDRDIIFLAGHGNWNLWDVIDINDLMNAKNPFGSTCPVVFVSACKTGSYVGVFGMAEAFLHMGAGVYLGCVESGGWEPQATRFFENWDLGDSVALAVKETKRSFGDDCLEVIWNAFYQVYGDAKFGSKGYPTVGVAYVSSSSQVEASPLIDVAIPDYEVHRINGEDFIELPGGDDYFNIDMPLVPCWRIFQDYPKGCQIQDVRLKYKSEPIVESGLNVPKAVLTTPNGEALHVIRQSENTGWWPGPDFEWTMIQNPESSTLAITVFPFQYNAETAESKFYKSFQFDVIYTYSNVEITKLATDKSRYQTGEPAHIDIELRNIGSEKQDVVVNVVVKDVRKNKVVGGLMLRTLENLEGDASYSTVLETTGYEPGDYELNVELRDKEGYLLDKKIENIRVGTSSGEVKSLDVPESFKTGDEVKISMSFQNTGNINITGNAVIRIYDSQGNTVDEFEHEITDLNPLKTSTFTDTWDTDRTTNETYKIIGYVLYEGDSTVPTVKTSHARDTVTITVKLENVTSTTINIDNKDYTVTSSSNVINLSIDTEHEVKIQNILNENNGQRLELESATLKFPNWSAKENQIFRTNFYDDAELTPIYKLKYNLVVDPGYLSGGYGSSWHLSGSTTQVSVPSEIPETGLMGTLGGKRVFSHWSGDSTATTLTLNILMDGPKTVTAVWTTNYTQPYTIIGASIAALVLITILLIRRRPKNITATTRAR
jgi:hypothetical protein